jgi:PadR family transcriptional regulator, regulatory protein PadR
VNRDTQLLKGVLPLLLMHAVRDAEDYGYAIVVRLRRAGFDDLAEGTVYPALSRLEQNGLVDSRLVASSAGPARKYYRLTREGRAELARAVDAWRMLTEHVEGVLSGD